MGIRRRAPDPILMGLPSPAIFSIVRMNQKRLAERIEALQRESVHLLNKIERISSLVPQPVEKIDMLITHLARLRALEKIARERLVGKQQRQWQHRERGGNPPRRL